MRQISLGNVLRAALVAGLTGVFLLFVSSKQPWQALSTFFLLPIQSPLFFSEWIEQAALILLCALGFAIAFRTGSLNLGGEGQFSVGAVAAAIFALSFSQLPLPLSLLLASLFAAACSGLIGGLIGLLRVKANISEIITSFLCSLAVLPLIDYLIGGPWRDQNSSLLATPPIPSAYFLPKIMLATPLSIAIFVSLAAALVTWFVLRHSLFGYDSRVISSNPEFGKTQGIWVGQRLLISFILSAAFHGIAGAMAVFGTQHAAFAGLSGGIAWNGIAAALIAKTHPLAAITGSLLIAFIQTGGRAALIQSDISQETTLIMQGVFFLFITIREGRARRD